MVPVLFRCSNRRASYFILLGPSTATARIIGAQQEVGEHNRGDCVHSKKKEEIVRSGKEDKKVEEDIYN